MNRKNLVTPVVSILLLFISLTCTSPTEPELQPGRRDYVWTVDTLNAPYDTYYRMWGSSPSDVWAVSSGDWNKSIIHFNGNGWYFNPVSKLLVPNAIFGFSSKDIYIGAENGTIWHYDGNNWKQIAKLKKDGNEIIVFNNIWGDSPNDFFAFGAYPDSNYLYNNSVIAHFINNKWNMLNTEGITGIVGELYKNHNDQKIYLRTLQWNNGKTYDSIFVYEYYNEIYNKIYSGTWEFDRAANISLISGEVYFILGRTIAKRINNKFQTIVNIDNLKFYHSIWGRNSKDLFLLMTDGLVHYNGSDMEYLFYFNKTPRTQIFCAALFEKEVFFLVYESSTNLKLVYHGKLK